MNKFLNEYMLNPLKQYR